MRTSPSLMPLPVVFTLLVACGPGADDGAPVIPDGYVLDADGDGFTGSADCDDARADVHPTAPDAEGDGVDADCDGVDGTGTATQTDTGTATQTDTGTATPTGTDTATDTGTATPTDTDTGTDTGTPTDTDTGTDTGTSPTNAPPTEPEVWLAPSVPHTGDDLWAVTAATDADGDVLSYTFVWSLDGVEQPEVTGSMVPGDRVARGGAWSVSVVASDGEDDSTAGTAAVIVANSAPSITAVTLSPAEVTTNTVLTANVTATDVDLAVGDTLFYTYVWFVDGVPVSGNGPTLNGATAFSKEQTVSVRVIPRDDADAEGPAMTSPDVTVLDSPPTAPVVAIMPADAVDGDDLTCEVVTPSTDADGDDIAYAFAWGVDGVAYTNATNLVSSSVVDGAHVLWNESWTCAVVASADLSLSATFSSNVTIARSCNNGRVVHTSSGVDFVKVCAGTFDMGCTPGQASCEPDESPVMPVTLTQNYYVAQTEVTQGQYQTLMGSNPSSAASCGIDCPVEQVTWHMAASFANALSLTEGLEMCYHCTGSGSLVTCDQATDAYTCGGYRLPTEAEWEGAARCGEDLLYAGSTTVNDVAWHAGNSGGTTHEAATKYPNACGLHDMSGNVWEWTQDRYSSTYYMSGWRTDPTGASSGSDIVTRGGSWFDEAGIGQRVVDRRFVIPSTSDRFTGFRLVRTAR